MSNNYLFLLVPDPGVKSDGSSGKASSDKKTSENKHLSGNPKSVSNSKNTLIF